MRRFAAVIASIVALGTLGLTASLSAQNFGAVQIRAQSLGGGIYMLMGQGGNIGLSVGEDGVFIIDDQFAPLTEKILAAIAEITSESVRFVFNTHWHGDHTGGNENLGRTGALIVAHTRTCAYDSAWIRCWSALAASPRRLPLFPAQPGRWSPLPKT